MAIRVKLKYMRIAPKYASSKSTPRRRPTSTTSRPPTSSVTSWAPSTW